MKKTLFILIIGLWAGYAQPAGEKHHAQMPLDCKSCHVCERPTYEKPCLKIMPEFTRRRGVTVYHRAEDAPAVIKIDVLSNLYEPTIFTHRLHAEMADMAGGCVSCHHFNPPGRIAPCRECHDPNATGTDLSKPGLKGAYHRQCLNCHRQWSHSNECTVCHAVKGDPTAATAAAVKAAKQEVKHPTISEPGKLVYQTEADEGAMVTFYHDDHARAYGLTCVNCHQNESCGRCHDTMRKTALAEKEPHDNCMACHAQEIDNRCEFCHSPREKTRFDHERTGFSLIRFHSGVECRECHGQQGKQRVPKPDRHCIACHKGWNATNFDHRITGLALDENHIDLDCNDCHANRDFAAPPTCTDCHDDLSYPKDKPGRKVD